MQDHNSTTMPEGFYEQLIASGPPCVVISADTYRITYVNCRFEEASGYSNARIQKEEYLLEDIIIDEERERLHSELRHLCLAVNKEQLIFNLKDTAGKHRSYMISINPLYDADGHKVSYYLIFNLEATALQLPYISYESRSLILQRMKDIGFGSYEWLVDEERYYHSASMYRIFEIPHVPGEDPGDIVRQYVHPEDRQLLLDFWNRILNEDIDIPAELRIITPAQKVKVIGCLGHRVKDSAGNVCKTIISVKDITIQRGIEAELKKNVEDLYHSNKELEQFAYVASHDLQEPLRKVSAFGGMLADKYAAVLEGDGKNYLDRMIRATDNMKIMINHLLEFSRITQGAGEFAAVSLDFVLLEVKSDLSLLIEETGTQLEYKNLPSITGDLVQLKQLMSNLVNNAIKFRKQDAPPVIRIEAAPADTVLLHRLGLDAAQPHYTVTVSDNGIGFEQEYASRIFKIFQRLHGKSAYAGSGIGLAICQRIVENHKGSIYAESVPGQGAVFTIVLPA